MEYSEDYKTLAFIRESVAKMTRNPRFSNKDASKKVRAIIEEYLTVNGVDMEIAPISLLSDDFLKGGQSKKSDRAVSEEIKYAVREFININMPKDPELYARLSERLEQILERLTSNVLKGVLLGAVVTGLIQSSAATTVMCVGFVNAGIMKLEQTVAWQQEILDRTNQLRRSRGLSALGTDPMLTQAAQVRAEEMAATGAYSHTRPDGSDRSTVSDCPYTAENIHRIADRRLETLGKSLADVAMEDWENSPSHLKNLLHSGLSDLGVGLARGVNAAGEDCWYCVQMFTYEGYRVTWVDGPVG